MQACGELSFGLSAGDAPARRLTVFIATSGGPPTDIGALLLQAGRRQRREYCAVFTNGSRCR